MKIIFTATLAALLCLQQSTAQITPLQNNESLTFLGLVNQNKGIFYSEKTKLLWVCDGTPAGTFSFTSKVQISANSASATINGKLYFAGTNAANGLELWATDGSDAGTVLVKDINPGAAGSAPADRFVVLGNHFYFSAFSPASGRELWKSDGTSNGTVMVKDISAGAGSSNQENLFKTTVAGNLVFFVANTAASGEELWRTNGTEAGTFMVREIRAGNASATPIIGGVFGNKLLFSANDGINEREPWISDGTTAGTFMLKDVFQGPVSSSPDHFVSFKDKFLFSAFDILNGHELWISDGTSAGTSLLKDIEPGNIGSMPVLVNGIKTANKFYFTAYTSHYGQEIWETDGTAAGTKLFADIESGPADSYPILMPVYANGFANPELSPLFQGNKFFFSAFTSSKGRELYVYQMGNNMPSLVKDLDNGIGDGYAGYWYYISNSAVYFSGYDGTNNGELFKSDGTASNTGLVGRIRTTPGFANVLPFIIINNKLLFTGDNGDDPTNTYTDLYRVDVSESPLPVDITSFTGRPEPNANVLNWQISNAINFSHFTVERSSDAVHFAPVSQVYFSNGQNNYQYIDEDIKGLPPVVYYRLRMTDLDGSSRYSDIVRIRRGNIVDNDVHIFKSGQSSVSIEYNLSYNGAWVRITDLSGRVLQTARIPGRQGTVLIPLKNISAQALIITVQSGSFIMSRRIF